MADLTIVAIFLTSVENSYFPVSKQMVKVELSLDTIEKITCFTRGEQAILLLQMWPFLPDLVNQSNQ